MSTPQFTNLVGKVIDSFEVVECNSDKEGAKYTAVKMEFSDGSRMELKFHTHINMTAEAVGPTVFKNKPELYETREGRPYRVE